MRDNKSLSIERTNSSNRNFGLLVEKLDKDLLERYNELQLYYRQFNKIENNPNVVIAYAGNEAAGCGCFKPFDATSVEIKRMYVTDEHRGKGIGAAILKELEIWAAESGYRFTVLETGNNQPEAIHLYQKLGYRTIPNYGQYADMETSICMKKELK